MQLKCVGWNCNSWGREKKGDKALLLSNTNASAILLCETWLRGEDQIEVENYVFYGNNRAMLHTAACVGSGGVAILINKDTLKYFKVVCVDSTYDSVLLVKLNHVESDTNIALISCYVPPDNSRHGLGGKAIFDYLTQLLNSYEECDTTYICDDFNARLGEKADFIQGIDEVTPRESIDTDTNKQCGFFLGFSDKYEIVCC